MVWNGAPRRADPDEVPTEPAPAMHSYFAPKFPPDPKLPTLDEATFAQLCAPHDSGYDEVGATSTFHSAPVVRHVYVAARSARVKSA